MLISIIILPLLTAINILFWPKKANWLALAGSMAVLVLSIITWLLVKQGEPIEIRFGGLPQLPFILLANPLNATVLLVVTLVAFSIFIYANGYMASEQGKTAFWSGMSLFLAGMELVVLSGDWVSLIMGWEIMGFASYRLIATWHEKKEAQAGANKAFMLTRVTDMGLYLGLFLVILHTGTSSINPAIAMPVSLWAGLALLLAVMGKSAQVPFQSWLSGAMAGPTPVSALLHSATLVAAGILLLLKAYPLLPETLMSWMGLAGSLTILLAGLTAIFSDDLKQMLAASTSSQLGFMLLALAAGFPGAAVAHLMAHAFMKSSLFLGSGIWQHAFDSTSFNQLKAAGKNFRLTYLGFLIAGISLAGVPPLVGYYSKDAVLAAGLHSDASLIYFTVAVSGALLTALYMGRSFHLLWQANTRPGEKTESFKWMRTGMFLLVLVVAIGGLLLKSLIHLINYELPHATLAIIFGLIAAVAGLLSGWFLIPARLKSSTIDFIKNNYPIAGGYYHWVVVPILKLAGFFYQFEKRLNRFITSLGHLFYHLGKGMDNTSQWLEAFTLATGRFNLSLSRISRVMDDDGLEVFLYRLSGSVKELGKISRKLQSGLVHQEMMWSVIGFVGFIIILIISIF
ncbi:MAG: NADH-quinone oxidoreductase subunit 5 family protein [Candidatus Cyclobacteriaceae bacterium M3_2C_046]